MRVLIAALVLLVCALPVAAESKWSGAGWYEVDDIEFDGWISRGPFASIEECKAQLPEDDEDISYYCEYFESDPGY